MPALKSLLSTFEIPEEALQNDSRVCRTDLLVKVDSEYGKVGCVFRTDECSGHLNVIQVDKAELRVEVKDIGKGDGSVCRII